MPDVLIAAIAQTDDVARIEAMLARCTGMDASRIALFKKDAVGEAPAPSRTRVIPFRGASVTSGTHGTSVPGMGTTLALSSSYSAGTHINRLRDIGISHDASEYYNIAIDEDRCVVTYVTSTEDATSIEEQFRACGFVKVRRFKSAEKAVAGSGTGAL
jgi:hypothetical protein